MYALSLHTDFFILWEKAERFSLKWADGIENEKMFQIAVTKIKRIMSQNDFCNNS